MSTPNTPSLFQTTRAAAPIDLGLWALAAAMGLSMVLVFAAAERLHWLG